MLSGQEHPRLLSYPDGSDQQMHRSLEKRRMIAFDPVTQEQERPAAHEKRSAPDPLCEKEQDESGKYQGNANAVEQFIPAGRVFVIVLRHVVRQTQSAPPCGGQLPRKLHFIPNRRKSPEPHAYKSRRPSMAFSIVTSSAYSRSAPTGMPTQMRVTRTPSGFSSLDMLTAVASASSVGFVGVLIYYHATTLD